MVLRVVVATHKRCAYVHVRCHLCHLIQRYTLMRAIVPLPHSSPHICSNITHVSSQVAPVVSVAAISALRSMSLAYSQFLKFVEHGTVTHVTSLQKLTVLMLTDRVPPANMR